MKSPQCHRAFLLLLIADIQNVHAGLRRLRKDFVAADPSYEEWAFASSSTDDETRGESSLTMSELESRLSLPSIKEIITSLSMPDLPSHSLSLPSMNEIAASLSFLDTALSISEPKMIIGPKLWMSKSGKSTKLPKKVRSQDDDSATDKEQLLPETSVSIPANWADSSLSEEENFDWAINDTDLSLPEISVSLYASMSIESLPPDDWTWAIEKTNLPTTQPIQSPTLITEEPETYTPSSPSPELSLSLPEVSLSVPASSNDDWSWATVEKGAQVVHNPSSDPELSQSMPEFSLSISMPSSDDFAWVLNPPSSNLAKQELGISLSMPEVSLSTIAC